MIDPTHYGSDNQRVQEGAALGKYFWLYVVIGAKMDEPKLRHIHNPAAVFRMDKHNICTMREGDNRGL